MCQTLFDHLKSLLVQSPVLAYPKYFTIEMDASIKGLAAVLYQHQEYDSRVLSKAEENYTITELETLAAVWVFSHFQHLVYGHYVTVVTNCSVVKVVLGTPSPSAKHARWWDKVYGCGAESIEIIYLSGCENSSGDVTKSPSSNPR